jgi:pyruvate/2-oxoglutarate dehydrogenase complex dihydrolipoamide acyltransferase (E2) component
MSATWELARDAAPGVIDTLTVPPGSKVKAGAIIARVRAPGVPVGGHTTELRAPVKGTVATDAAGQTVLRFCPHDTLLNTLCIKCGDDTGKLSAGETAFLARYHRAVSDAEGGSAPRAGFNARPPGHVAPSWMPTAASKHVQQGHVITTTAADATARETAHIAALHASRRLTLVLDIDHTLLHTTDDPRAAPVVEGASRLVLEEGEGGGGGGGRAHCCIRPPPPPLLH